MSKINSILDRVQRLIATQKKLVTLLVKLRNQINKIIAYSLVEDHIFEKSGELVLIKHLSPFFKTCIDVGANIGEWTDMVLQYSTTQLQKIILIEPGRNAFDQLSIKFSDNNNLILINKGLGHINSYLEFNEQLNAGETSSFINSIDASISKKKVEVITLDDLLKSEAIEYVDFLKIDCEGFDFNVLKGAENTLKHKKIGIIQFEYNAEWIDAGATLKAAYLLLVQNGYQFFLLNKYGLSKYEPDFYGEFFGYSNFVAISDNWIEKVETLIVK